MSENLVYRLIAESRDKSDIRFKVSNIVSSEPFLQLVDITTNEYNFMTGKLPITRKKFAYANIEYRDVGSDLKWHPYNKLIKRLVEDGVPVFVQTDLDVDFGEGVVVYSGEEESVREQMLEYIIAASDIEEEESAQYPLIRDEQLEEDPLFLRPKKAPTQEQIDAE